MRIELSADQQRALLAWAADISASESAADCEPAGYVLEVAVSSCEVSARAVAGPSSIQLGEVTLTLGGSA